VGGSIHSAGLHLDRPQVARGLEPRINGSGSFPSRSFEMTGPVYAGARGVAWQPWWCSSVTQLALPVGRFTQLPLLPPPHRRLRQYAGRPVAQRVPVRREAGDQGGGRLVDRQPVTAYVGGSPPLRASTVKSWIRVENAARGSPGGDPGRGSCSSRPSISSISRSSRGPSARLDTRSYASPARRSRPSAELCPRSDADRGGRATIRHVAAARTRR
jgi:hypothetical protein